MGYAREGLTLAKRRERLVAEFNYSIGYVICILHRKIHLRFTPEIQNSKGYSASSIFPPPASRLLLQLQPRSCARKWQKTSIVSTARALSNSSSRWMASPYHGTLICVISDFPGTNQGSAATQCEL